MREGTIIMEELSYIQTGLHNDTISGLGEDVSTRNGTEEKE
jgi:hypothetical protein